MPRQGLDTAAVVEAAAQIADADGPEAVTLARLARRLGVRAPSLYNHVDSRAALLRLLALRSLRALGEALRGAAVGLATRDALAAAAHAYRAYALAHPGCYQTTQRPPDPDDDEYAGVASSVFEVLLAVLRGWNLRGEEAIHAVRVIRSALHGFVTLESAGGFGLPVDLDESFARLVATLADGLARGSAGD